jgi:hypothetical protein
VSSNAAAQILGATLQERASGWTAIGARIGEKTAETAKNQAPLALASRLLEQVVECRLLRHCRLDPAIHVDPLVMPAGDERRGDKDELR